MVSIPLIHVVTPLNVLHTYLTCISSAFNGHMKTIFNYDADVQVNEAAMVESLDPCQFLISDHYT